MAQNYSGVPSGPLSAYLGVRETNRQAGLEELQEAGVLQKLAMQREEQRELNELKGVVAKAGGNPQRAVEALLKAGTPKSIALAAQLRGMLPKPAEPFTLAPGAQRRGPGGELIAEAPFKPEAPLSDLGKLRADLQAGRITQQEFNDKAKFLTTRQAAVNVYSGGLTPAIDEGGNPVFVQSSGREDVLPRVVPGVRPPPSAAEKKATLSAAEEAATLAAIEDRTKRMADIINKNYGVVGPAGTVRRLYETGVGMVPGLETAPSPATDYKNETGLLLADVRKMVEKDPNLSNQERQNLMETMGAGTIQNPGSAIRALAAVSDYVKRKKGVSDKQFEVGKVYRDSKGNRARYKGNGQWENL